MADDFAHRELQIRQKIGARKIGARASDARAPIFVFAEKDMLELLSV
jgi:hypothetical protein